MSIPSLASAGGPLFTALYAGQIAETFPHQKRSGVNTNAAAIDFGKPVAVDATSGIVNGVKPWSAGTDLFAGVSVRNPALQVASADGNNTVNYPQRAQVPLLLDGVIGLVAAEDTRVHDQVLILDAGTWGSSKGGVASGSRVAVPGMNAVWLDEVTAGTVARAQFKTVGTARTTT